MNDLQLPILALRVLVLTIGGIFCLAAAMKAWFRAFNLPESDFKTFFTLLGSSVFVVGVVLVGFAIVDTFKFTSDEPAYRTAAVFVAALGVLGIFLFVYSMRRITRFVSMK